MSVQRLVQYELEPEIQLLSTLTNHFEKFTTSRTSDFILRRAWRVAERL